MVAVSIGGFPGLCFVACCLFVRLMLLCILVFVSPIEFQYIRLMMRAK